MHVRFLIAYVFYCGVYLWLKLQVSLDELRTKYLLLFISDLENIDDEIWDLNHIHDLFINDPNKSNYRILWVPVVMNGTRKGE